MTSVISDTSQIELRHLRYFLAVAETLHFGKAAQRLNMSQPPLSQQIQQLEEALGGRLFERSRRKVSLTPLGSQFREGATALWESWERLLAAAREGAQGRQGVLRVGFVSSAPFTQLPLLLREHRRRFPEVSFQLEEWGSGQQIQALRAGELDLGFIRLPAATAGLEVVTVAREQLLAALPEHHPQAEAEVVELSALAAEAFVLFPRRIAPGLYGHILELCLQAGFTPRIGQEVEQMHAIVGLVAAGLGISLVPESMQIVQPSGLVYRRIRPTSSVNMGMASRAPAAPLVDRFLETARDCLTPGAS